MTGLAGTESKDPSASHAEEANVDDIRDESGGEDDEDAGDGVDTGRFESTTNLTIQTARRRRRRRRSVGNSTSWLILFSQEEEDYCHSD